MNAHIRYFWLHAGAICLIEHLPDGLTSDMVTTALITQNPTPSSAPPELLQPYFRAGFPVERFTEAHDDPTSPSDDGDCACHIGV